MTREDWWYDNVYLAPPDEVRCPCGGDYEDEVCVECGSVYESAAEKAACKADYEYDRKRDEECERGLR